MSSDTDGSHDHDEVFDPAPYRPSRRRVRRAIVALIFFGAVLVTVGIIPRWNSSHAAIEDATRKAKNPPRVTVAKPIRGNNGTLSLPGSIAPFQETTVYARVNGYLHHYRVDIGDRVKKGQIIGEIDTPDLDQQLSQAKAQINQARAALEQTKSKVELARITNTRYSSLVPNKYVSVQIGDESKARLDVEKSGQDLAEAALISAEANSRYLEELKNFATLVAPFDGVITSRTTEDGQLVTVGMDKTQAIFRVARTDIMRMFINIPQLYVPSVKIGGEAVITVREYPNREFKGTISRTTRELDKATRTLVTQIDVPNADDVLIAGMYAQADLPIDRSDSPLKVPSSALIFDAEGTRLAVVEKGKIRWRTIRVDGDAGTMLAISSGLNETDDVVVTPSGQLVEGLDVVAQQSSDKAGE